MSVAKFLENLALDLDEITSVQWVPPYVLRWVAVLDKFKFVS